MKRFLVAGLLTALLAGLLTIPSVGDEPRIRLYSNPTPPPKEALDRLNLRMAWRAYVPVEGRRDGLLSVQTDGKTLYTQTRSGMVALFDAETGRPLWRTRVGSPYGTAHSLAYNSRSIFVISGTKLYALDRNTGTTQWEYGLPTGISTAPLADELQVYVATASGRVFAFELPRLLARVQPTLRTPGTGNKNDDKKADEKKPDDAKPTESREYRGLNEQSSGDVANPAPVPAWDVDLRMRIDLAPLGSDFLLFVPGPEGLLLALNKFSQVSVGTTEAFRYDAKSDLGAAPGRFDDLVFLGCMNGDLHAINVARDGERRWRYTAGSPITRTPVGVDIPVNADRNDQDLYVVGDRLGLARIDRETGEPLWRIPRGRRLLSAVPEADRFLAANRKFVYAMDRSGRLLVLDRRRGTLLSTYDVRDFVFPVPNDTTDRLFLAANNGLLVCLHDKEFTTPINFRAAEEKPFDIKRLPPVDRETLDDLEKKLRTPVTDPGGEAMPLRRQLNELERRFALRIDITSDKTFKEAKMEPIGDKPVSFPKVKGQPLAEVLKQLLAQVNADFKVHDRIYIVPAKKDKEDKEDKDKADKDK